MQGRGTVRSVPFWGLFGATVLSNLSDGIVRLVLPLLAIELTRSPTLVALSTAFAQASWLVFVLLVGALIDRADRRQVMLVATWLRVAALAGFAWLVAVGGASLPVL